MDAVNPGCDVWPAGTRVAWLDAPRGRVFFAAEDPRVRVAAAGFLPASRPSARALRLALLLKAWLGVGPSAVSKGGDLSDYLGELEASAQVGARESVRVGSGQAARSLVVRHRDDAGAVSAYTRVLFGTTSATAVTREARILESIAGSHAPVLSGVLADSGRRFSAITTGAMSGRPFSLHAGCPHDLEDCLPVSAMSPIERHPWVVAHADALDGPLFEKAVSLLAHSGGWPVCVMHGDAAPWNALRSPDGFTQLFDWEFGETDGLWLFDRAFWELQTARLVDRSAPAPAARRAVDRIAARYMDVSRSEASGVAALMALSVSARMTEAGTGDDASWWSRCAAECVLLGEKGLVR